MSVIIASVEELVFTKDQKIKEFMIQLIPEDKNYPRPVNLMFKVLTNIKTGIDVRPNFGFLSYKTKRQTNLKIKFSSLEQNSAKLQIKWLPSSISDQNIEGTTIKHEQFNQEYKQAKLKYAQKHLMIDLKKIQEPIPSFGDSPSISFKKSQEKVLISQSQVQNKEENDLTRSFKFSKIEDEHPKSQAIKSDPISEIKVSKIQKEEPIKNKSEVKPAENKFSISKINFIFIIVLSFLIGILAGVKLNKLVQGQGHSQESSQSPSPINDTANDNL